MGFPLENDNVVNDTTHDYCCPTIWLGGLLAVAINLAGAVVCLGNISGRLIDFCAFGIVSSNPLTECSLPPAFNT
jgi:hypothetical protein